MSKKKTLYKNDSKYVLRINFLPEYKMYNKIVVVVILSIVVNSKGLFLHI